MIRLYVLMCMIALVLIFSSASANAGSEPVPVKSWKAEKSCASEFTFLINCNSGTPFSYNPSRPFITDIIMNKNPGGFVVIQAKITNSAPWRKTFRIKWDWRSANGLMSTAPADAALTMVTLGGKEQQVIQGTSTVPNPTGVVLSLFPHAK